MAIVSIQCERNCSGDIRYMKPKSIFSPASTEFELILQMTGTSPGLKADCCDSNGGLTGVKLIACYDGCTNNDYQAQWPFFSQPFR